ncbi:hypothetical protein OPV22_004839 [Ensete ventricosum]|uniref:Uncharacterized protein n=1 Tax=Ensete ventricosum TaxID=4639 RepID=A0AAV8RPT0_ENSVE|nr:hypothetical protein OPV22_004839 [Ensete ventricosum]
MNSGTPRLVHSAVDIFYLTDEQLKNPPSRKDGTSSKRAAFFLDGPFPLVLLQQVFSVKRVAASCVWLPSKLEE